MRFAIQPVLLLLALLPAKLMGQTYKDSMAKYRQAYKKEFLTDKRSPLKAEDTGYLRFYEPDASYRVTATFRKTEHAPGFLIPTHSGKNKPYREYGTLRFKLHSKNYILHAYQSADTAKKELEQYLFIPFNDKTNYTDTYGGGRYLDMGIEEVKTGRAVLDFNKCYNPYCAYAGGYSCPIPPEENKLKTAIRAGEKLFGKKTTE